MQKRSLGEKKVCAYSFNHIDSICEKNSKKNVIIYKVITSIKKYGTSIDFG